MLHHRDVLAIGAAATLAACGGGKAGHAPPVPEACPSPPGPADLVEPIEVVGDGTPGSCTEQALRDVAHALNAGGGGSITFDCGPLDHTITLTEELVVESDAVVDGGGRIILSGGEATRIFSLDHYVSFAVQHITLADARADEFGAAIYHPWYGTLRVVDVRFENNECTTVGPDMGGGAFFAGGLSELVVSGSTFIGNSGSNGGAIDVNGSNTTIVNSFFQANEAFGSGASSGNGGLGGAVYIDGMNRETGSTPFLVCGSVFDSNRSGSHGSAIFRYSYPGEETTIRGSTFNRNEMYGDSGSAALYHEAAPLSIVDSTFSYNTSTTHAGVLHLSSDFPASISNSTFVGNETAGNGGAIFATGAHIDITNATFAHHYADYGPAIFCGESCTMTVRNTIFAYNQANDTYDGMACTKTMDGSNNIQWPAQRLSGSEDIPCTPGILFADPLLQDLADNGGPTQTMALSEESPAIDAGDGCPETDQRGEPRSGPCDIGAFEH